MCESGNVDIAIIYAIVLPYDVGVAVWQNWLSEFGVLLLSQF